MDSTFNETRLQTKYSTVSLHQPLQKRTPREYRAKLSQLHWAFSKPLKDKGTWGWPPPLLFTKSLHSLHICWKDKWPPSTISLLFNPPRYALAVQPYNVSDAPLQYATNFHTASTPHLPIPSDTLHMFLSVSHCTFIPILGFFHTTHSSHTH